jgi:hypothetical protein
MGSGKRVAGTIEGMIGVTIGAIQERVGETIVAMSGV